MARWRLWNNFFDFSMLSDFLMMNCFLTPISLSKQFLKNIFIFSQNLYNERILGIVKKKLYFFQFSTWVNGHKRVKELSFRLLSDLKKLFVTMPYLLLLHSAMLDRKQLWNCKGWHSNHWERTFWTAAMVLQVSFDVV